MYPGLCTEDYNERPRVHADIAARTLKKWEFLLLHEIAASLRDGSGGKVVDSQREAIVNHVQKERKPKKMFGDLWDIKRHD
ncbi:hypothetical protein OIU78_008418 [Salix suchowensis]|nr:hypothetical protein OIU78_008418 [Salix suchowensis]